MRSPILRRRLLRPALALLGAASLSIASASCDRTDAARGNIFTFIDRGNIITLDINQMSYMQDFRVMYAIREGLYSYNPVDAKPIPALATATAVSDDKRTWTFTLRDDAKWSNGDAVTSADFVFSWRLMLESPGEYTSLYYYIENARKYEVAYRDGTGMRFDDVGIKAPDAHTLVVTLDDPVPYLPDILAFPPFYPRNERSMKPFIRRDDRDRVSYDAAYARPGNVVTNGPFDFTYWESGDRLSFRKSGSYWDCANVKLDGIEDIIDNDPQSAYVTYDQGGADWLASVHPDIALPLHRQGRPDLKLTQDYGTAFLTFNCKADVPELKGAKNPLADVRVRRALAMVIDKQLIVDKITRLDEHPADRYIPPGYFDHFVSKPAPSLDVEGAKRLLAEAGYPGGSGMPTLSFCYNTDSPIRSYLSQSLTKLWKDTLNVTVAPRPMENKGYKSYVNEQQYTIAPVSWYGDYMDASTWTDKYRSTSQNNSTSWTPPAYDDLLDRAAKEPDEIKRAGLLADAESMLNVEAPIVPLYYYVNSQMYRDDVHGITPNARNTISFKAISVDRRAKGAAR